MNKRVIGNIKWIIACRLIQSVVSLVIGMLMARYLGPSNYGVINYASALVAFATPFMQLGLNSILVNEIIRYPEREGETVGTALLTNMISSVVCMVGVIAFAKITNNNDRQTVIVCALYCTVLFFQAFELFRYWFNAKLLSKYSSLSICVAYILASVYKCYLLITGKSIYWFALINSLDSVITAILFFVLYRRFNGQKLRFSAGRVKEMLRSGRPFIVSSLMITFFTQTDKIMLKMMLDETTTGYYSAAVTSATMFSFVYGAIIDSFRPMVLGQKHVGDKKYENTVKTLYSVVIYISLAQCLAMTFFSDLIIAILYGEEFVPTAGVLRWVVWFTTFSYIGGIRSIWLQAEGKQRYLWIFNLAGAVLNVTLNWVLIPKLGMYGAAIASVVAQLLANVVLGSIIKNVRENNRLMFCGLNPRYAVDFIKSIFSRDALQ